MFEVCHDSGVPGIATFSGFSVGLTGRGRRGRGRS
jgi:hypothetical protein